MTIERLKKPIMGIILAATLVITLSPTMQAYAAPIKVDMNDFGSTPGDINGTCSLRVTHTGDIVYRISLNGFNPGDTGHVEVFNNTTVDRLGEQNYEANNGGRIGISGTISGDEFTSGDVLVCQAWASLGSSHMGLESVSSQVILP